MAGFRAAVEVLQFVRQRLAQAFVTRSDQRVCWSVVVQWYLAISRERRSSQENL